MGLDECANGDYTITLMRTANGKMIEVHHNVMTPRPYDRKYQLTGTEGFANKYPIEGFTFMPENIDTDEVPDHEDLNAHGFVPEAARKALMEKYMHPIHREVGEIAKKVGGHGGMDFVMDSSLHVPRQHARRSARLHPRRLGQDRRLPLRLQEVIRLSDRHVQNSSPCP